MQLSASRTILTWTLAWGVTGIALYFSGVFNSPRTGPLWAALAGGMFAWSIAGAFTFRVPGADSTGSTGAALATIWAAAYLLSFALAALATAALRDALGGFFFSVVGWAVGPALAAFLGTRVNQNARSTRRSALVAVGWLLATFTGGYVALFGLYIGPELGKMILGPIIGQPAALTLGAGFGMALGGLVASAIAVALTRRSM